MKKTCVICNKIFKAGNPKPDVARSGRATTCSYKCQKKKEYQNHRTWKEKNKVKLLLRHREWFQNKKQNDPIWLNDYRKKRAQYHRLRRLDPNFLEKEKKYYAERWRRLRADPILMEQHRKDRNLKYAKKMSGIHREKYLADKRQEYRLRPESTKHKEAEIRLQNRILLKAMKQILAMEKSNEPVH